MQKEVQVVSWEEDLNLRSREATDLQSVAIDHSAIPGSTRRDP